MPTHNRPAFVGHAIDQFLRQDYFHSELIIIDDSDDPISDLVHADERVRYHRLNSKLSLGAKRNLASSMARGTLIAHWDDDDWMAPGWLGSQVQTICGSDADICGLASLLFFNSDSGEAWRYRYDGTRPWVAGGTMCYTKERWQRHQFEHVHAGEDNLFVWSAVEKTVAINPNSNRYLAHIHRANTSPKDTTCNRWTRANLSSIDEAIATDVNLWADANSRFVPC